MVFEYLLMGNGMLQGVKFFSERAQLYSCLATSSLFIL